MAREIRTTDDYLDALGAEEIGPAREDVCPECGGRLKVRAHAVGRALRVWINCEDCKAMSHGDRGPMFAGWEVLDG